MGTKDALKDGRWQFIDICLKAFLGGKGKVRRKIKLESKNGRKKVGKILLKKFH